jgi:HSP20 family protein
MLIGSTQCDLHGGTIIYRSPFPRNLFAELDRLQRDMQQALGIAPAIRGSSWGGFPAMNMGHTADSIMIFLFVPGVAPEDIDAQAEKGVLIVSGERRPSQPDEPERHTLHIDERYAGHFRRVITLPDDVDDESVQASYQNGVLTVTLRRKQRINTRKIPIQ